MLAVIPCKTSSKEYFLHSSSGRELLQRRVRELIGLPGVTGVLATGDSPALLDAAAGAGAQTRAVLAGREEHDLVAPGGLSSLEGFAADRPVLVLNPRNPELEPDTMARALEQWSADTSRCLLSTSPAKYHPCSLNTFSTLLDAFFLCLVDGTVDKANHALEQDTRLLLTRPFPFDWNAQDVRAQVPVLVRRHGRFGPVFEPLEDAIQARKSLVWLPEGDCMARLGAHPDLLPGKGKGVLGFSFSTSGPATGQEQGQGPEWVLATRDGRPPVLSRWGGAEPSDALPPNALLRGVALLPKGREPILPGRAGERGFALSGDLDRAFGVNCLVTDADPEQHYQVREWYPQADGLWEQRVTRLFNSRTGELIQGRQQHPEVLECDRTLYLGTAGDAFRLPERIGQGRVDCFRLTPEESLVIEDEVQALRQELRQESCQGPNRQPRLGGAPC